MTTNHTPGPWYVSADLLVRPANARLIAAAPELLAALQAMVEWYRDDRDEPEEGILILEQARTAIQKASQP